MKSSEYLYRPQHKNRNELINDFVIRNSIYDRILHSIETEVSSEASQHILIEGKRGMGKTTLMLRLTYELQNKEELKKKFVPCKFNEEEYGIANLSILWERIAEHLEEDERFDGIIEIFDDIEGKNDEEKFISEVLKWLEEQDVIAIVFIDNFFQIIEKFTTREQQRLREVLIKTAYIKIIAGSARFLERNVGDYASPFFEFFKREKLNKLDEKETKELLIHLAEKHNAQNVIDTINNEPQRIANIRILCGGVPRTLVTFFEVLMDDANGNSIDDLKLVMDRTNELYLQRMNSLSNKEQPIIHAMALHWEAISTGELAEKVGEKSGTISAMLTKLSKQQIIEKVKTDTKNHLWRIEERFFNIWYLMTQAPRRYQRKVKWLTAFIEALYCEDDFKKRLRIHLKNLEKGSIAIESASIITQALSQAKLISMDDRDQLISKTRSFLLVSTNLKELNLPKTEMEIQDSMMQRIIKNQLKSAKDIIDELPDGDVKDSYLELIRSYSNCPYESKTDIAPVEELYQRINDTNQIIIGVNHNAPEKVKRHFAELIDYRLKASLCVVSEMSSDVSFFEPFVRILYDLQLWDGLLIILNRLEKLQDKRVIGTIGTIYFIKNEREKALNYLKKAFNNHKSSTQLQIFNMLLLVHLSDENYEEMAKLAKENTHLLEIDIDFNELEILMVARVFSLFLTLKIDSALNELLKVIKSHLSNKSELTPIFLNLALANKQKNFLIELFTTEEKLKDEFLAYYFLLMKASGKTHEFQKMPPELNEPILRIESEIKEWELIFAKYAD